MIEGLNNLARQCFAWATRHGFHEAESERDFDGMLMNTVTELAEAHRHWRDGGSIHEISYSYTVRGDVPPAGVQMRSHEGKLQWRSWSDSGWGRWFDVQLALDRQTLVDAGIEVKPDGVPIEFADVLIRVLDICGRFDIDIERAVREKMAYNEGRPWRNGGKLA